MNIDNIQTNSSTISRTFNFTGGKIENIIKYLKFQTFFAEYQTGNFMKMTFSAHNA